MTPYNSTSHRCVIHDVPPYCICPLLVMSALYVTPLYVTVTFWLPALMRPASTISRMLTAEALPGPLREGPGTT